MLLGSDRKILISGHQRLIDCQDVFFSQCKSKAHKRQTQVISDYKSDTENTPRLG
ncbi:hypothetical protein SynMVIR181_00227 [Synechococcus sp. MVIR-18-1]|nr:hypothetical protein SynMVIR181_00227 [Synechococcus sp. MVIR-18-1]